MQRTLVRIVVATVLLVLACVVVYRYVYLAYRHGVPSLAIPQDRIDSEIAAARSGDCKAAVRLRCGVLLVIEYGSYHEARLPAHAEAAELAVADALRGGLFTRGA